MRKLLKEHFKELLKEEIDFSSKTATVYHLTGFKTADYDPVYAEKMKKTNKDLRGQIKSKYAGKEKTRAQSILSKAEYKTAAKELKQFKTPQGQAYYIGKQIEKGAWDLGSNYVPGHGKMYAKGLYTCYKLNPTIARTYGSVILRFEADISSMLIFNAGIAKSIYGKNFRLEDQFLEICKKMNVDIRGFWNQEASFDFSADAQDAISEFIEMLTSISNRPEFLNSSYDAELRTAPFALQAIEQYSRLFKRGRGSILRNVINGVIFWGRGDGPVCIVYNPEITLRHKLTGAGYFDKKGEPIIEDVIERLIGRSGTSLADTFEFAQEIDEEAQEIEKARAENFKQQLANFSQEEDSTDDFLNNLPSKLNTILSPITNLYKDACDDLIMSRVKDTQPDFDNYCQNVAEGYRYVQFICSILSEPFLQFVDIFGPGLDIVSKDEFEKYCYIFKQYSSNLLFNDYSLAPKLADFELNGLKCAAQNEEEFAKLVEQHLKPLTDRFNEMLKEGLASEFVNEISQEAIGSGEIGVFNNSITKFEIGEVSLNTTNDAQTLESSLEGSGTIMQKAEQELLDLFNDERVKTPEGQSALESMLQYNKTINTDGTLDFGEIVKSFGYYSDYCHAGGDIFYTLCEQIRSLDYAGLGSYKIDRDKFNPEFILQRMYGQKEEWKVRDAAGLSLSMFKDGRKAYNDTTLVTTELVKQRVIQDKSGNLEWVVETVFDLPRHREKLII